MKERGFTLIELMVVLAIVAILAAVAISTYDTFLVRSRVTELVDSAKGCATAVEDYYQSHGSLPATNTTAGCSTVGTESSYPPVVLKGHVIVRANGALKEQLLAYGGTVLDYAPDCAGDCDGHAIRRWRCSPHDVPATVTNIAPKFLPPACR